MKLTNLTTPEMHFLSLNESISILENGPEYYYDGDSHAFQKKIFNELDQILSPLVSSRITHKRRNLRISQNSDVGIVDIFTLHEDNSVSLIAVKNSLNAAGCRSFNYQMGAIGELLSNKSLLDRYGYSKIRLFIIDNCLHRRTFCSISEAKLPISLIQFNLNTIFSPYIFLDL